ncbi:hypothetical protein ACFVU0_29910 [Streptomyces sp. NPDC058122]|uniref:hypothetical protein n=1 Tax=Streptomyces sp. NPDC058122 TaxID=3346349 RepID=UPI0036E1C5F0
MRLSRRFAPVFAAVAVVLAVPHDAMSFPHTERVNEGSRPAAAGEEARKPAVPQPFGAECRITVTGSQVVAYCHNPYVGTDHVALHVECARWWDIDTDGTPVEVGPAMTVRLTGRCWKEVRAVWITHGK